MPACRRCRHKPLFFDTETKLTASDAVKGDEFGYSVAISGNTALVGARLDDDGGTDSGLAYLYAGIPEPSSFLLAALASLFGLGTTRRRKEISPQRVSRGLNRMKVRDRL